MIEYLRRKMNCFIWAIVSAFVLSTFVGSASLLWFSRNQNKRRAAARALDNSKPLNQENKEEDVLDVDSRDIAARISLDGETSVILAGELNRKLKENEMFQRMGGKISKPLLKFFYPQILENLIDQRLLMMKARTSGIDVSADIEKRMQSLYTQAGGKEALRKRLAAQGSSEGMIRDQLARQMRYQRLIQRIIGGRNITDQQAKMYYDSSLDEFKGKDGKSEPFDKVKDKIKKKLRGHITKGDVKRYYEEHKERWRLPDEATFRHLFIDASSKARLAAVSFTEQELRDYYEKNKESKFLGPKKYVLSHVFLDPTGKEFLDTINITDADIEKEYKENKEDYYEEEQYKTANILFKVDDFDDKAASDEARKKCDAALARISGGENFQDVAKEVSEDLYTRDRGGVGAFWSEGMKSDEVEKAVVNLKIGQVAGPVKTPRGWELLKLIEKREPHYQELVEVEEEIRGMLLKERAEQKAMDRLKQIRADILDEKISFEDAARKYSMAPSKRRGGALQPIALSKDESNPDVEEVGESGYLDFNIQNVLKDERINQVTQPTKSSRGIHLLRLNAVIPPKPIPYEECKKAVEKAYRSFLADEEALQLAVSIADKIRKGEVTFAKTVEEYSDGADKTDGGLWKDVMLDPGVKPSKPREVLLQTKSTTGINQKIINAVRLLREGEVSQVVKLGEGYHLFQVVSRKPPRYEKLDDELEKEIRFALNPVVPEEELRSYFKKNADRYRKPAQVVIAHIMLRKKEKAQEVLDLALHGKDFAFLVKKYSIDYASKRNNGEVSQQDLPDSIKKQVDKIKPGEIVPEVVRTPVGYHVVKLVRRETEKPPSFEEARESIQQELLTPRINELLKMYVHELRQQAVIETWEGPDRPLPPKPVLNVESTGASLSNPTDKKRDGDKG